MGGNGFAGYIDPELFLVNLNGIVEIDISNNLFYGDGFPHGLLKKPKLKLLDVSANALRGSLPDTIDVNSVLEVLEINSNGLTGTIPSSIENLVNLKHLDMQMVREYSIISKRAHSFSSLYSVVLLSEESFRWDNPRSICQPPSVDFPGPWRK